MRCAPMSRCRRSVSSGRWRASTASSISVLLLRVCSIGRGENWSLDGRRVSTLAWRSPTATPNAPPIRPERVPGARSIIVAARSYLADEEPARPAGAQARVARYAWVDHYGPLRAGLRAIAGRLRSAGERAIAFADDNAVVDREVAYLGGLGLVRQERQPARRRRRELVRARIRRDHSATTTPRCRRHRSPTAAARAADASTCARPAPSSPRE